MSSRVRRRALWKTIINPAFASLALLTTVSSFFPSAQAQTVATRHVRELVRVGKVKALARLAQDQEMSLDIVLPLRDPEGLSSFLKDVYDPQNSAYRHFLTPSEFAAKFGPAQADYDAVLQFARINGLTITGGSREAMDVQVKGSVTSVETAFHLKIATYQHPTENRTFFGPDREPVTNLPFHLWHVSGLDNYSVPHRLLVKKSEAAEARGVTPEAVVSHASTGSGPSASFLGSDMRAAYATGTSLNGAGQDLGLLEYAGTNLADLTRYYNNVGQTNQVPVSLLSVDGTSTACNYTARGRFCDDVEQNLDMTQALGMAPGLNSLTMYIGSSDTAIMSAMTTHSPLPMTIGCSWGWTPVDPATLDPFFQRMAAQGQTFFAASGDSSTWSSKNGAWPADDAYVVSVGGTSLVTAGAGGPWVSEGVWSESGGGVSPDGIPIPSWQTGAINSMNHGSTTLRNGPDVSANADYNFYTCGNQTACLANTYGGTSFAAPMWAGLTALLNQRLQQLGQPTLGFPNPLLYPVGESSSYGLVFHDITSGTSGSYSAVPGYDLVTGWGSPNATMFSQF